MTCHEIKELTVPYLELDLEPSRIRDVTGHLDGCAGCRAEMEAVRQVLVRVKGVSVPDPGDRFWKEFPDIVRRGLARERPPGRSVWTVAWMPGWPLALAASVVLIVGAWSLRGLLDRGLGPPEQSVVTQGPSAVDLPGLGDADWEAYWEDDPDMVLVEMATQLDGQTMDRLFADI